jgi:hypothetical protein
VKKTFAGVDEKSVNCQRFGDPIDESNAPNEALDETNAAVPSDSADDARIGSNCSADLSPELEPPRTSASNTGS